MANNTNGSITDETAVWPDSNHMAVNLQAFVQLKEKRNATTNWPVNVPFFRRTDASGNIISIKGNPGYRWGKNSNAGGA